MVKVTHLSLMVVMVLHQVFKQLHLLVVEAAEAVLHTQVNQAAQAAVVEVHMDHTVVDRVTPHL